MNSASTPVDVPASSSVSDALQSCTSFKGLRRGPSTDYYMQTLTASRSSRRRTSRRRRACARSPRSSTTRRPRLGSRMTQTMMITNMTTTLPRPSSPTSPGMPRTTTGFRRPPLPVSLRARPPRAHSPSRAHLLLHERRDRCSSPRRKLLPRTLPSLPQASRRRRVPCAGTRPRRSSCTTQGTPLIQPASEKVHSPSRCSTACPYSWASACSLSPSLSLSLAGLEALSLLLSMAGSPATRASPAHPTHVSPDNKRAVQKSLQSSFARTRRSARTLTSPARPLDRAPPASRARCSA